MIKSYNELSIGKYNEILELCRELAEDEINRNIAIVSVLTGRSEQELGDLPLPQMQALTQMAGFLAEPMPVAERKRKYVCGDYTLIPTYDFEKMTTLQYKDFKELIADPVRYEVELLACFLVPEGCVYGHTTPTYAGEKTYDMGAVRNAIRDHLSVADESAIVSFLEGRLLASTRSSLRFSGLTPEGKIQRRKIIRALNQLTLSLRNGGGSIGRMKWQRLQDAIGAR